MAARAAREGGIVGEGGVVGSRESDAARLRRRGVTFLLRISRDTGRMGSRISSQATANSVPANADVIRSVQGIQLQVPACLSPRRELPYIVPTWPTSFLLHGP